MPRTGRESAPPYESSAPRIELYALRQTVPVRQGIGGRSLGGGAVPHGEDGGPVACGRPATASTRGHPGIIPAAAAPALP